MLFHRELLTREHAEARARDRHLEELRVAAAHLVATLLVTRRHLGVAHRERCPARDDRAEAIPTALGCAEKVEIDLDIEDALHAAHVGMPERLVRVDECARPLDARAGIHHLVAVHLAAVTFDLVLRAEGQFDRSRGREAVAHLPESLQETSTLRKT